MTLVHPPCPHCGSPALVSLARTWANLWRVPLGVVCAFAVSDLIALDWRCARERRVFRCASWHATA